MLKAVIFDMDGVIIDSEIFHFLSKDRLLKEQGIDVELNYHARYVGTTFISMWTKIKADFPQIELSVEECIERANILREEMIEKEGIKPIRGVLGFIRNLYENGLPLAVASSSPQEDIRKFIYALGIEDCFEHLISAESVAKSKPAPDVFLAAAKALKQQPDECLVIEDSSNGVAAAKAAGMTCIGFHNPDYPEQDIKIADYIIDDFGQLSAEYCQNMFT